MGKRGRLEGGALGRTITVHRRGYTRKAYTRKDGVRVKRTRVPATTFKRKDIGAPGRGRRVIEVEKGAMEGYSTTMSERARHRKLDSLVRKHGATKVWRMLHAQCVFRKRMPDHAKRVFEADRDYIKNKYAPDIAGPARRKWMRMSPRARAKAMPGGRS